MRCCFRHCMIKESHSKCRQGQVNSERYIHWKPLLEKAVKLWSHSFSVKGSVQNHVGTWKKQHMQKTLETASAMIDLLLCHGTNIYKMNDVCGEGICVGKYCVCKRTEDQQMKVVRIFLDKCFNPLPESSKWAPNTLVCAAKREHMKVLRLLLQAINDTHGVSLDDVQRNLRFLETYLYFRGPMGKLWGDCYWRKKYPVP